jgi:hypothetical protein
MRQSESLPTFIEQFLNLINNGWCKVTCHVVTVAKDIKITLNVKSENMICQLVKQMCRSDSDRMQIA